ncbi:Tif35p [Saccharomyces cerevisiae AWRI796]|nr:Tif35p [Saccharomyces cerevisiae AWRI796]
MVIWSLPHNLHCRPVFVRLAFSFCILSSSACFQFLLNLNSTSSPNLAVTALGPAGDPFSEPYLCLVFSFCNRFMDFFQYFNLFYFLSNLILDTVFNLVCNDRSRSICILYDLLWCNFTHYSWWSLVF